LTQSDNQARAAIAAALGDFKGDEGAFSTETKLVIYGGIRAGRSHAVERYQSHSV